MIRTSRQIANTWYLLVNSINLIFGLREQIALTDKRLFNHDILTLNLQLILNSAALIEGVIKSLLITHILKGNHYKNANNEGDKALRRILDNIINEVIRSQWSDLNDKSKLILDLDLQKIHKDNWETVRFHFNFRNVLAHGGIIIKGIDFISDAQNVEQIQNEQRVDIHYRKSLFDFLVKKGLLNKDENKHILRWEFLSSEIANFFVKNAKEFIQKVHEEYILKYPNNKFIEQNIEIIKKISRG